MGPFKCPDCGVWWAGVEHRCLMVFPGSLPVPNGYIIRPFTPTTGTNSTSAAPWCSTCQGWHIPGAGPCTASYC